MADLGVITEIYPTRETPRPIFPVSEYKIYRGLDLGHVEAVDNRQFLPVLHAPVIGYVVRQIVVVYRQLWPQHGQRFPQ